MVNKNGIIAFSKDTRQYSQPKGEKGFLMFLGINRHMLHNSEGYDYFAYPTSDEESLPDYLDRQEGLQNLQRAMQYHLLAHIDNRSSFRHGLIVQAPLDLVLLTSQNCTKNINRVIQSSAGKIATIALRDIQVMEEKKVILKGDNYHDGFKLSFTINFIALLASQKNLAVETHAYKRLQEALLIVSKRSPLRRQYGENLANMAEQAGLVVSKWDTNLLKNYGQFDRQVLEDQLPMIFSLFQGVVNKMYEDAQQLELTGIDNSRSK